MHQFDRSLQGRAVACRIGQSPRRNVKGCPVIGGAADKGQTNGGVNSPVEGHQLHGNQALVMVEREIGVVSILDILSPKPSLSRDAPRACQAALARLDAILETAAAWTPARESASLALRALAAPARRCAG